MNDVRRATSDVRRRRSILPAVLLLVIVASVAWDQTATRALARDIDAIAARGEPVTAFGYEPGADTPERHDAARIYAAALERARAMPQDVTFRLPRLDVDIVQGPPLDLEAMEKIYRLDAPALQLLDQATPLDFNGFGELTPGVAEASITTLNYLGATRADFLSARGKGDEAALALIPCVRLWRAASAFTQPIVMTRIGGSVRILLRHTSPGAAALEALQRAMEELPQGDDLERQIIMRRARFIDEIHAPRTTLSEAIVGRLARPWIAGRQRRALSSFDLSLAIARDEWPRKFVRWTALEEQYRETFTRGGSRTFVERLVPGEWIGVLSMPVSLIAVGRDIAVRRVIIVTLGVERYRRDHAGTIPASLDALVPQYLAAVPVDPFSGHPIVYAPAADRYVVYSVDDNRKNDEGKIYGFGSKAPLTPRRNEPHDLGIAVAMKARR